MTFLRKRCTRILEREEGMHTFNMTLSVKGLSRYIVRLRGPEEFYHTKSGCLFPTGKD